MRKVSLLLFLLTGALAADPQIRVQPFVSGLAAPVDFDDDGSGRFFVVEQAGKIQRLENNGVAAQPFLDITAKVKYGGEMGLLGLAFHPQFRTNGRFFVNYTTMEQGKLQTVVSEFKADPNSAFAQPASEREILRFDQPYQNHNGGQVMFGPDGKLYVGVGDGGSGGDPGDNAQRLNTWLGKILRVDVDSVTKPYGIPADNPFVKQEGALPEIWAWGLRNPWRFAFDHKTGLLYVGDVGQNKYEEVSIVGKGQNMGWSAKEGFHDFKPERAAGALVDPIKEYARDKGNSITGGRVYRGKKFPELDGLYFYSDYSSRRLWALKWDGQKLVTDIELTTLPFAISAFGQDHEGEIYLCDYSGKIFRLLQ